MPVKRVTVNHCSNENRQDLGYVGIIKQVLLSDLSVEAQCVYIHAMSHSDNWVFHRDYTTLEVFKTKSTRRLLKAIEELRNVGLVTGSFKTRDLTFYELPYCDIERAKELETEAKWKDIV